RPSARTAMCASPMPLRWVSWSEVWTGSINLLPRGHEAVPAEGVRLRKNLGESQSCALVSTAGQGHWRSLVYRRSTAADSGEVPVYFGQAVGTGAPGGAVRKDGDVAHSSG